MRQAATPSSIAVRGSVVRSAVGDRGDPAGRVVGASLLAVLGLLPGGEADDQRHHQHGGQRG